ncbi:MAG: efflux RND transporter periplasmic adaptor subunit [Bryobacterales bacterium]|nr:efflux RND transporter periplasmic adaptor subunit [Bryobacterales bacterium]
MPMQHWTWIGVIAGALLLGSCGKKAEETAVEAPKSVAVNAVAAQTRTVSRSTYVTGSLLADESVTVTSEVAGRVAAVYVDFGQSVRKGQPLIALDTRELQLRLDRTRGALAQALARLGLPSDARSINVKSTPALDQARAQLAEAKFKFENGQRLVKSGDISQERFQELDRAFKQQEAAVEAAEFELHTQIANVQALMAEVKLSEKSVADARQYAPFDGSVTERMVSPGQYLKENTPMMTIVKSWPLRLRLEVPETTSAHVKAGRAVTFRTDALPGETFEATVREMSAQLDPHSRTLTAEARVSKPDSRLRPGMFVSVELVTEPAAEIVVVPKEAIYTIAGLTKTFVLNNGKASERKVPPPTYTENGLVGVPVEQVKPGDLVAVTELPALYDGVQVTVKSQQASVLTPSKVRAEEGAK